MNRKRGRKEQRTGFGGCVVAPGRAAAPRAGAAEQEVVPQCPLRLISASSEAALSSAGRNANTARQNNVPSNQPSFACLPGGPGRKGVAVADRQLLAGSHLTDSPYRRQRTNRGHGRPGGTRRLCFLLLRGGAQEKADRAVCGAGVVYEGDERKERLRMVD